MTDKERLIKVISETPVGRYDSGEILLFKETYNERFTEMIVNHLIANSVGFVDTTDCIEIKNCPFCGKEAEFFYHGSDCGVHCTDDDCIGNDFDAYYDDEYYAAEAWNRRAET